MWREVALSSKEFCLYGWGSHLTEGISWRCGFMETGLLPAAADLEFAELF